MFETLRRAQFTNPIPGALHVFLGCAAPVSMPLGKTLKLQQVDSKALEVIRNLDIALFRDGIILVLADDMEIIPGSILECILKHLAFVYCKFYFRPLSCSTIPDPYGVRQGRDSQQASMILHRDMSALRNMPLHLSCPLTDVIEKKPPRCPVLIVLPGPSLQDTLPDLQRLARHFAVVCVGRSLQFCLNNGVSPDFVVNLDTDWRMAQLFMGLHLPQTWFISLSNGNISSIASRMRGVFFMDSFHPGVLRNRYRMRESWLSVSICCLGLAEALGAPQVLLLGADNCWAPTDRKQPGYAGTAKTDCVEITPEDATQAKLPSSGDPRSGNGDFFLVSTAGGEKAQTSFLYYAIAGELDDIAFQMRTKGVRMWQWEQKGILNPAYYEPLMPDSSELQTLPPLDRGALHTQLDKAHRSLLPIALDALEQHMQSVGQNVRVCLATLLLQQEDNAITHPAVSSVECLAAQGCMPSPSGAVSALEIATASCQEWLRLYDRAWAFSRLYICRKRRIPMRLLYHDEALDIVLDALGKACPDLLLEPVRLTIFPIDALTDAEAQARELYGGILCHEEPVLVAPKAWQRIREVCTLVGQRRLLAVEEILELERVKIDHCTPSTGYETKPFYGSE